MKRAVLASSLALALLSAGAHGQSAVHSGLFIPAHPGETSGGKVHSTNWSGYAVRSKSHSITGVSGQWVVPGVTTKPIGIAATWTGIGGFNTHDLIQAGTVEQSQSFGRRYYAWYELLPHGLAHVHSCKGDPSCKVSKGDRIAVNIHRLSRGEWKISITDKGHWHWSKTVAYKSSGSSAEWILEAPMIGIGQAPLANVGTVHFGPGSRYSAGGATRSAASGNPIKIFLAGQAAPSALASDGQSFNDCAYHHGTCPRP